MTQPAVIQASTIFLSQLVNPAVRALILGLIVGVGLAVFRVKNTSLRLFSWTAVLYAALAMPLLQQILPPLTIPAPDFIEKAFLPTHDIAYSQGHSDKLFLNDHHLEQFGQKAAASTKPMAPTAVAKEIAKKTAKTRREMSAAAQVAFVPASPVRFSIDWTIVATGIYIAIAFTLLLRFLIGLAFGRRLLRSSQRINDPRLIERLAKRASNCGLTRIPGILESQFVSVPLTMGAWFPKVLLPFNWRQWDDSKLDTVLAHELSHVGRRDALTQRVSLLHRAFFWFSPLAWWLDRHLGNLAEQASDEAVLNGGVDRKEYARTLLTFFEALQTAPERVRWQGVSMAKSGQAEQRVERILSWKGSIAMKLKTSIAVAVVALAVPVVYLSASAQPSHHEGPQPSQLEQYQASASQAPASAPTETTPPAEPGPASGITTEGEGGAIAGPVSGGPVAPAAPAPEVGSTVRARLAPVAPVGPSAPVAAIAPVAPVGMIGQSVAGQAGSANRSSRPGFSYHYGFDDEQRFVIVSGKTDSLTMSGSTEDARHVEKLRKNIPGDFIWFERDEKSYVVRDQATIDRAKKLWEPQEDLGKKQEALGKQQEALGKQQEALGARMQQIRVNVPDMNADLEKLKAELKQLSSGASVEQIGHIQSEIGDLQSKIGDIQSHAGEQQGKLGEEMGALGEQQGKLGEEQGKLGEQQGKLAEQASHQMKQLLDEAITKGTAQPEI